MAVTGVHVLLYSPEAEPLRAVFRDVLGWRHVDAGGHWLIFALPPAEIAVHPAEAPARELAFMCDDLDATVAELQAKGIEVRGDPQDAGHGVQATQAGWGIHVTLVRPGGVEVMLYQPHHATAIEQN